ncbi:MAG: hypothetical protein GXZ10_13350 [Gammaproteobacteria bacterium]|nr:hypothetical protein [Gammaproteobacteria bacterium]
MKTIFLALAFGFIGGAALSYSQTAHHYEAKASREQDAYVKALAEVNQRSDNYKTISEEYYADYQDAINREPTTVTERVFVRTSCPTNATADTGRELGNGATSERVELHAETVRSATAVTDQAERDVLSCRAALHSLQRKIQAHNELQWP